MKTYDVEIREVATPREIVCDVCKKSMDLSDPASGCDEVVTVNLNPGFYSECFEDGDVGVIDVCEQCFFVAFGSSIRWASQYTGKREKLVLGRVEGGES